MRPRRKDVKLAPPLSLEDCLKAVGRASKSYAEATNLPARWTSKSWFVVEFAKYIHELRGHGGVAIETDGNNTKVGNFWVGNFFHVADDSLDPRPDLVICENWGNGSPDDDHFGDDEEFFPPFHAVKIFVNTRCEWPLPSKIANAIKGPLTVSLLWINNFGSTVATLEAIDFKLKMESAGVEYGVSTEFMRPGIVASVSLFERAEPFQILVASQTFPRERERNPLFKPSKVRDPRRHIPR